MNKLKDIWEKLKAPKPWFLTLFYVLFIILIAGTLTLVILVQEQTFWHYILYAISAVTLAYFVYTMVIYIPKWQSAIIRAMKQNKFTRKLLASYGYRTIIFSICAFTFSCLFVAFQGVLSIISLSIWYGALTIYYLVLVIIRGCVLIDKKKFISKKQANIIHNQENVYKYCGILLIVLTLAFSGVIVLTYKANYFEYAGLMIYALALYTFLKLTIAIVNLFKAKKVDDLYVKSLRNIDFADALISIFALQVAMFQEFAPELNVSSIANALTGGAVTIVIVSIGIYMIISSHKRRKYEKQK